MNESRVASRYAKALLDLAKEKGVLEEVHKDMGLLVAIADENPQLARVLKNPIVPHAKKRAILESLFKGRVHNMTFSIFDIITNKNREEYLYYIAKGFLHQYRVLKGIQSAEVTTTVTLSDQQRDNFISIVKKVSGKEKVELTENINESIIGGFVLNVGDQQIDQSIRLKLTQLKNNFKDNPYISKY